MVLVGLALLVVVGCSGSKVTTKSSAELSRYQIRTIASGTVHDSCDATGEGCR